jgi:hypothetical protein
MITATLTVDDYISAHRLHYQRLRRIVHIVGTVLLIVGAILAFTSVKWAPIVIFGSIFGLLGQWWEDRYGIPTKVRKLYHQFKGLSEPLTFHWDAEKIEGQNADGHARRKWRDYVRLKENDEVILLYITDQLWHVYPKRWFTDLGQLEEFRRYASTAGET